MTLYEALLVLIRGRVTRRHVHKRILGDFYTESGIICVSELCPKEARRGSWMLVGSIDMIMQAPLSKTIRLLELGFWHR